MTAPHIRGNLRSSEVRSKRANLKREVAAGEVLLSEMLREVALPDWLHGMDIAHLLAAVHGVSFEGACGLCSRLGIPELKAVGRMTYRQRCAAAAEIVKREKALPSGRRARPRETGRAGRYQMPGGAKERIGA